MPRLSAMAVATCLTLMLVIMAGVNNPQHVLLRRLTERRDFRPAAPPAAANDSSSIRSSANTETAEEAASNAREDSASAGAATATGEDQLDWGTRSIRHWRPQDPLQTVSACRSSTLSGRGAFEVAADVKYNDDRYFDLLDSGVMEKQAVGDAKGDESDIQLCLQRCEQYNSCGGVLARRVVATNRTTCRLKRGPVAELQSTGGYSIPPAKKTSSTFTSYLHVSRNIQLMTSLNFSRIIAVGMLSAPQYLQNRAAAALGTWLCNMSVVVLLEHQRGVVTQFLQMLDALPAKCRAEKVAKYMHPVDGSRNGAWKNLPLTQHLLDVFPRRSWYMIVDDDTFMFHQNLNIELTSLHNPNAPLAVGMVCPQQVCATREIQPTTKVRGRKATVEYKSTLVSDKNKAWLLAPQGGAGFVLSHAAIVLIRNSIPKCSRRCKMNGGDTRIGCCMHLLRIPLVPSENFWCRSPFLAVAADGRGNVSAFPVSFHMMRRVQWVYDLYNWSQGVLAHLTELCRSTAGRREALGIGGADGAFLQDMSMCGILDAQQKVCSALPDLVPAVPISWSAVLKFLGRPGAYPWELFVMEPGQIKSLR
jgi:hypothetical protein